MKGDSRDDMSEEFACAFQGWLTQWWERRLKGQAGCLGRITPPISEPRVQGVLQKAGLFENLCLKRSVCSTSAMNTMWAVRCDNKEERGGWLRNYLKSFKTGLEERREIFLWSSQVS